MQNKPVALLMMFFCIIFITISGCTSESPPTATPTLTPQLVYITVTVTPSAQINPTSEIEVITIVPTPIPSLPPSTTSEEMSNFEDEAFLTVVADNNIVQRIDSLAVYGCDITEAGKINQLIISNKKPNNSTLLKARDFLISATTYCQAPEKPARDQSKTKDDLDKFSVQIKEYAYGIPTRSFELDKVLASVESIGTFNMATFSGNSDNSVPFTIAKTGLKTIKMEYAGQHNFVVKLGGEIIANKIGSYSGVEYKTLPSGKYVLNVTASGPWTIEIS